MARGGPLTPVRTRTPRRGDTFCEVICVDTIRHFGSYAFVPMPIANMGMTGVLCSRRHSHVDG
jgi:hypothetical protein